MCRIAGLKTAAFQAVAHLLVGGMFARGWKGWTWDTVFNPNTLVALLLTVVETVVFFATR